MCSYCSMIPDIHDWSETDITYSGASDICDGQYEYCKIVYNNDKFYIVLRGSHETYSEPLNYCPFCGRKLNE